MSNWDLTACWQLFRCVLIACICSGIAAEDGSCSEYRNIGVIEFVEILKKEKNTPVVDVRDRYSDFPLRLDGSIDIPHTEVRYRRREIPGTNPVVICRTGLKSNLVSQLLVNNGFDNVRNLHEGMIGLTQYIAANESKDPETVAFLRERIVADSPIVGLFPPEIELRDMQGSRVKPARYAGKKTVVLLFWMVRDERSLQALTAMHEITAGNDGVEFIPVYSGKRGGELDEASELIENLTPGRSLHTDPGRKAAAAFEVQEMPALVLIDKKGILRASGIAEVHQKLPHFWENSFGDLLKLAVSGEEIPYPEDQLYGNQRTPMDLEGRSAPDFTLIDGRGNRYSLEDYRGRNVVLVFWTFYCPYSRKQLLLLGDYYRERKGDIEVLSIVSRPQPEHRGQFERFIRNSNIPFPILFNDDGGSVSREYFVSAIPVWMVIDESGVVKAPNVGYSDETGTIIDEVIGR
jgi:peroxiredoxin/rhodanese-related sulfurtransferase